MKKLYLLIVLAALALSCEQTGGQGASLITWTAEALGSADPETSDTIKFTFSEAVADLRMAHISIADGTGSAFAMEGPVGGGQEWSLGIAVASGGRVRISIDRAGVENTERALLVYREGEGEAAPPEKNGIAILSLPDTTVYARNMQFDSSGLVVAWTYSNGSTEKIPPDGYTLTEPDMANYTDQRVTVSAGGYTARFTITVMDSDRTLTSISVSGGYRREQDFYRAFDKTGLVVTGHYSDGSEQNVTSYAGISGYDSTRRGPRDGVMAKVNGKSAPIPGVRVRIPADMAVTMPTKLQYQVIGTIVYRRVCLKGESFEVSHPGCIVQVNTGNGTATLSHANGGLLDTDTVSGYDPNTLGRQNVTLHLDEASVDFPVTVIDLAPAAWFDYGYQRTATDPTGKGPGADKYYARPGETIVLAPVRFLVGYDRLHRDTGASYSWSVSGGAFSSPATATGEFYRFTPTAPGTSTVTVQVTGNNYITSQPVTVTATTELVCFTEAAGQSAAPDFKLMHTGPGQYVTGGAGYGWSLGSGGGYEVWGVEHRSQYWIRGNGFGGWVEPGVVWVQEDRNANNIPDEMWYELTGSEDTGTYHSWMTRRYAIYYIDASDVSDPMYDSRGRLYPYIYWADSKGRAGMTTSNWPADWPAWKAFTFTQLRDPGDIIPYMPFADCDGLWGYVDTASDTFPINRAIRADGSPITLSAVKFIKVQSATFDYVCGFGDRSTEIYAADFLGYQTDFPLPEDS
ncbi:MAG: bacterial Ig-like domain-containing protein [Treponema sp.]|jgi:hypothetical protein|nr:bacterial Ig-like domain-containing protein [Treponema sp.]